MADKSWLGKWVRVTDEGESRDGQVGIVVNHDPDNVLIRFDNSENEETWYETRYLTVVDRPINAPPPRTDLPAPGTAVRVREGCEESLEEIGIYRAVAGKSGYVLSHPPKEMEKDMQDTVYIRFENGDWWVRVRDLEYGPPVAAPVVAATPAPAAVPKIGQRVQIKLGCEKSLKEITLGPQYCGLFGTVMEHENPRNQLPASYGQCVRLKVDTLNGLWWVRVKDLDWTEDSGPEREPVIEQIKDEEPLKVRDKVRVQLPGDGWDGKKGEVARVEPMTITVVSGGAGRKFYPGALIKI